MAVYSTSLIDQISVDEEGTWLGQKEPEMRPKAGWFKIGKEHANYHALHALAMLAAANRYRAVIRTRVDISEQEYGDVLYLTIKYGD